MKNALQILFEVSIYSSAMIIAASALGKLFSGKISAKMIHALWLMVLLRLLLPVTFESPVNIPYPVFLDKPAAAVSPETKAESDAYIDSTDIKPAAAEENAAESESASAPPAALNLNIKTVVFDIWLGAAALFLAVNLFRIIAFSLKIRNNVSTDIRYEINLDHAKKLLGIKRNVRIAESEYAGIPFVYGCFRPIILLPRGFFQSIGDEKTSYIILHELCHVKRHDLIINYLWLPARAIHWFNPFVHIAYKSYLNTIEEACDEMVVKCLGSGGKCEYSQSMLDVIRLYKKRRSLPLSVSFGSRETAIKRRVVKIMNPRKKSKTFAFVTILTACFLGLSCFTTACRPAASDENGVPETVQASGGENKNVKNNGAAAIKEFGLSGTDDIFAMDTDEFFGDKILWYRCNDFTSSYALLESDLSLVFFSNSQVSCWDPIGLSEEEYEAVTADYIKRIWGVGEVKISKHEVLEQRRCTEEINSLGVAETAPAYVYSIEGTMGENRRPFAASLNGKGELNVIISFPVEVDFTKGISKNEAQSLSLEYLEEWCSNYPEIDFESFVFAGGELSLSAYIAPSFAFKYEHRGDDPSACGFNFDCVVHVGASGGESQAIKIAPVAEDSGLIPIEEAKSLAKQYVIEKSRVEDIERLKINTGNFRMSNGETVYVFEVQYTPENPTDTNPLCYYYVTIDALKGKLLDIHIGLT